MCNTVCVLGARAMSFQLACVGVTPLVAAQWSYEEDAISARKMALVGVNGAVAAILDLSALKEGTLGGKPAMMFKYAVHLAHYGKSLLAHPPAQF